MNSASTSLNHARAHCPRVFSLHAPGGQVMVVFASPDPLTVARTLTGWEPHFSRGCVAVEWIAGEPVATHADRSAR